MLRLLLGVIIEVFVAVALAGVILAVAVPVMNQAGVIAEGNPTAPIVIVGVLVGALAIALFRPGSAIRRQIKR